MSKILSTLSLIAILLTSCNKAQEIIIPKHQDLQQEEQPTNTTKPPPPNTDQETLKKAEKQEDKEPSDTILEAPKPYLKAKYIRALWFAVSALIVVNSVMDYRAWRATTKPWNNSEKKYAFIEGTVIGAAIAVGTNYFVSKVEKIQAALDK